MDREIASGATPVYCQMFLADKLSDCMKCVAEWIEANPNKTVWDVTTQYATDEDGRFDWTICVYYRNA
jgi:hypothetical protein